MNIRRVLPLLFVALPLPAFASSARVGARIADLRAEPSPDAKSKAKLPSGRDLEVIGKSDDGQWVRVRTECPKANETIKFEGWLAVREVQGANLDGVSVAGSAKKAAPASDAGWTDSSASSSSDSAASKDEWGNDTTASAAPASSSSASSSDDSWDTGSSAATPAATPASSDSDAGWGSSDSSSSSPASSGSSSSGDDWGSGSSDSSSSSSSSSSSDSSSSDSSSSSSSTDGW